jgi:hypothetical protein
MKIYYLLALGFVFCGLHNSSFAQSAQPTSSTETNPQVAIVNSAYINEIQKLGIYVFPNHGQSTTQTQVDETDCYTWAMHQTGYDPLNPPTITGTASAQSYAGGAVGGAARGALVGTAVGAIAGNAGKGAAIGATAGGFRGIEQAGQSQAQAQQQAQASAQQQLQSLNTNFRNAFSSCMGGKGYSAN